MTTDKVPMDKCCEMKGFLSFLVLHLINRQDMSGEDIRQEIEKRKGTKPSPGTIYPVLKSLNESGWIAEVQDSGKEKKYHLTENGKKELRDATKRFMALFCDMQEEFQKIREKIK